MRKEEIFKYCRENEFPETILSKDALFREYKYLCEKDLSPANTTCSQLIQHFHPSLWKANVKGNLSPYKAWYKDDLLKKVIDNRLKYNESAITLKGIRAGFNVSKIAPKVSIFKPALSKYIISKYLSDYEEIFDPCSGYSGRLLGAACLGKKYVGQDINPITVKEANTLIETLELKNCSVRKANSLCTKGTYQCLLTCPPYADKEYWNQSIEVLSCDEWIDVILKNFICDKYVFVIDKTKKYSQYIAETISNKSYMSDSKELIVVINRNSLLN